MLDAARIFSDPANNVGDVVRIFCIVGGIVMLGLVLKVARDVRNTRQFGMYALVCFGVSAIGTTIENLGTIVTYRLLFNTAGVVLGIIFLIKTHQTKEGGRRATDTPHDRRS